MKKIAVITIYDNNNYGNRLQNYAVQAVIKKMGHYPENVMGKIDKKFEQGRLKKIVKYLLKPDYRRSYKKNKASHRFNENVHINESKINVKNQEMVNENYDYFLIGSDQIWNCTFERFTMNDFAPYAPRDKKISFSASFGINQIPDNFKDSYAKALNDIKYISVREEAGKRIIEELTGRKDIEVLPDPTMLLNVEEWDKVEEKPKGLGKEKFILNYFLGELSEERKKEIDRIAKENNCKVINILDKKDPYYVSGPSEFVYLEKHAFLVCTDSFHSSIFAILYNRPFIVFKREDDLKDMSSRLDTLLTKFKLEDRYYKGKITDDLLKCDYTEAYKILEEERKKAYNFLEKALR